MRVRRSGGRKSRRKEEPDLNKEDLVRYIQKSADRGTNLQRILEDFDAAPGARKQIKDILNQLVKEGKLARHRGNRYEAAARNLIEGRILVHRDGYGFVIPKEKIRGIESDGELASGAELGIGRDFSFIIELEGDWLLKPDHIIEIDNKSITHRPDLWGHVGMAREVAAISRKPLRDPVHMDLLPSAPGATGVAIKDLDLCPRYSALVFENVTVGPSPLWLQYRLESVGMNPINNIVDFTNLIMAELSQPTHAFDRELLSGDTIFIRPARAGERIVALNDAREMVSWALNAQGLGVNDVAVAPQHA